MSGIRDRFKGWKARRFNNNSQGIDSSVADRLKAMDGEAFVRAAYLALLGRSVDYDGLAHHMRLMELGTPKDAILTGLRHSPEGKLYAGRGTSVLQNTSQKVPAPVPMVILTRGKAKSLKLVVPEPTVVPNPARDQPYETLWVDMTTAFEWTGGVVGIVRAELEMAVGLKKKDPKVRFSMQVESGFAEILPSELDWLLQADNIVDAYLKFFGRHRTETTKPKSINVSTPVKEGFFHPYGPDDVVISFGWMDSRKEVYFRKLKQLLPTFRIGYLIYDIVLALPQTTHLYGKGGVDHFKNYIKWISHNADFILFGGETAKSDTEAWQKREGWPIKPGRAIKFGSDITKADHAAAIPSLLAEVGVSEPFILTVGSIEPRKNHETLYRAYLLALECMGDATPQLVIVGKPMWRADDLVDTIKRDPRLAGKVLLITPSDTQLAALYARCLFTLLPSLYEGWSLTLPESLGQGRFCLACDTPPLREIGGDLVDYIPAFDTAAWADKIVTYATNAPLRKAREARIAASWSRLHWSDTASMAFDAIKSLTSLPRPNLKVNGAKNSASRPTIWMDLTLTFVDWHGGISGIVRAELTYAYYLKKLAPDTRFFAFASHENAFFEISDGMIQWLFEGDDLAVQYRHFQDYWQKYEALNSGFRNPLHGLGPEKVLHQTYLSGIPENSIVFFAGIDFNLVGSKSRNRHISDLIENGTDVITSQLIYDLTPVLYPQYHLETTCDSYLPFLDFVASNFNHLVYGGRTARRDGLNYQKQRGLPSPHSDFVEFGSDLKLNEPILSEPQPSDPEVIERLGITGDFVMTVGTIEPRKNHEVLYKAYLQLLQNHELAQPLQLIFVGKPGWKTTDFLDSLNADARVASKILIIQPNDDDLAALYRRCLFTLLPSFYEGWSLTLPESLSYGKFCIVSDVDPLRETGGDLVEYIHPLDTSAWAKAIAKYANNREKLAEKSAHIRDNWHAKSWEDSTKMLYAALCQAHSAGRKASELKP